MRESRTVGIGVIGAGRIGALHAENLQRRIDETRVIGIAEPRLEVARALGERLGVGAVYGDHRELLSDPEVDAVAICSSTDTHAAIIEEAAAAGRHVFCEKPIAQDLRLVDRALEAVARAGVKLQVGFNRRFDASFRRVREAIEAGKIGELHMLRITSRDPEPPPISFIERSGGIFLDMTIHDFDMARYLAGSEVEEVSVTAAVLVDPAIGAAGDVDTAITTLRFASGAIGSIDNSRRAVYGYDQRVEAFGSGGMLQTENRSEGERVLWNADGVHRAVPQHFFVERYRDSFLTEMRAFVRSILDDTESPVSGPDGRLPILMALAAMKSHREHRPVRLDEVE